jgi:hypothetical protein
MRLPLRFLVPSLGIGMLGCVSIPPTHSIFIDPPAHVEYPQADPIELDIQLSLDDALIDSTEEFTYYQTRVILRIGRAIAESSSSLAHAVFLSVREAERDPPPASGLDAVLTPRIANTRVERAMWGWEKCRIEISVEWSLTDLEGRVIWTDTFTGSGEGTCGSRYAYAANIREITRIAIEEVMTASYRDMVATR